MGTGLKTVFGQAILVICVAFIAWEVSGCTSTSLTNMWRDQSFTGPPLTNILVIAVKKDPAKRRIWEDGLAAELSTHNVAATPSYRLFPDAVPDTQHVVDAIREKKYDGVLVVRKLPTEKSARYAPGYVVTRPVIRYSAMSQTYYTIYRTVVEPPTVDTEKVVRHAIDVWATKEPGGLVWTGTGETLDPASGEAVRNEVTDLIIPELARQGIIPNKKE
ncbi:MAG TPA: hypothetical protein VES59_06290 [Bacteroidota bacterium]|nr:hypothetical protein [Bacteroidota bacterium]